MQIKHIIDHQAQVHALRNWLAGTIAFLKVGNKLTQAQAGLVKRLAAPDAPQGLAVQLLYRPSKVRLGTNLGRNAVAHIPEGLGLPLGPFFIGVDRCFLYRSLDLVPLEADVTDGVQDLNPFHLPVELRGLGIDCGEYPPRRRGSRDRITPPLDLAGRVGEAGQVAPHFH